MSAPSSIIRFALQRLILIDSYTEGRITELPISGGTAITGRNGRGKTSLLQLIPAFYGERPDRIVRPVSNKKTFARYYLPRATSYVVYEYLHDNEPRCAVLFSDESGEGVQYRFFRSAYRRDLFVMEDECTLVMSSELPERLKLKRVSHSPKMSLDKYRSIIQGKVGNGSDRTWQRQMIHEYGFGPTNRPLSHIERIVSGMFARKTNFTDLQRMVVASIMDADKQLSLGAERKKIEAWPDSFDSYVMVMAEARRMAGVQGAYDALLSSERELRIIHARMVLLDGYLGNEQNLTREAHEKARRSFEQAKEHHDMTMNELHLRIGDAGREVGAFREKINELVRQAGDYDRSQIKEKANLLNQEAQIRLRKEQSEVRRNLLLDKQANISSVYEKLLHDLDRNYLERQRNLAEEKNTAREAHGRQKGRLEDERDSRIKGLQEDANPELSFLKDALNVATEGVGEANAHVKKPHPEQEVVEAHERQMWATQEARQRMQDAVAAEQSARQLLIEARNAYSEAERMLAALRHEEYAVGEKLKNLELHETPGEGSLLYALRTRRPDWTEDIAKVLREDLLLRTDLTPTLEAVSDGIYGLVLDLGRLDAPIAANEGALRQQIESSKEVLNEVRRRITLQSEVLKQANMRREQADKEAAVKALAAQNAKAALASAEAAEKAARAAVNASRESALSRARAALMEAEAKKKEASQRLASRQSRLERDIQDARDVFSQSVRNINAQLETRLKEIEVFEREERTRYESDRRQTDFERTSKLREAGVDTMALEGVERQLREAYTQLKMIDSSRSEIAKWHLWLEQQWSRKSEYESALVAAQGALNTHQEQKISKVREWQRASESWQASIQNLESRLKELSVERENIEVRRKPLEVFPPDAETLEQAFDPAWSVVSLVDQANRQHRSLREETARLSTDIKALKAVFTTRRGSPPDDYFDTKRQEIGPDRAEQAREWVPIFKAWFSGEHEFYRNLLREGARTIAEAIADFHGQMKKFQNDVNRFNRELQESLNTNVGFESIGGVSVEIVSTIRELEYWGTIEKLSESRISWMGGDVDALPPPEFATSLRDLLSHWQLKESIRAELTNLIRIQGEVVENGTRRPFRKAEDLETISSHGLSYIVLVLIFIGFINRVRGTAPVNVAWALDEIKDLDVGNVELLMDILQRNNITLVSACPDPDPDVLALFRNRCSIRADRCIYEASGAGREPELGDECEEEADHV